MQWIGSCTNQWQFKTHNMGVVTRELRSTTVRTNYALREGGLQQPAKRVQADGLMEESSGC
jgi:hypothetical protein